MKIGKRLGGVHMCPASIFILIKRRAIPFLSFIFTILLFQTVFCLGYVPSRSMEPTILAGDYIIGVRRGFISVDKNDIIIFFRNNVRHVKRVKAVPGDIVAHSDGSILMIPENCYYVIGDNQSDSNDSRNWDYPFVHADDVVALVIWNF